MMSAISIYPCVSLILSVTTPLGATSASVMMDTLGMVSSTALVSPSEWYFLTSLLYALFASDINECALGSDDCDGNAECTDTIGSFMCVCNHGYNGTGTECCKQRL